MAVLVVGLGSMGKRRVRLLKELYSDIDVVGVDGREDRRDESFEKYGIRCYESIEEASKKENIDRAFVSTSPLSHSSIITTCLRNNWHVFTEINLVSDGYDLNTSLAKEKGLCLFLSSTLLYREEVANIKKRVTDDIKWNYIYHKGQYLPDWHPWENFKDFFVGEKRTNGCREIFAIEMPWIVDVFGDVESMNVVSDKMTELNIDYHDNFMVQFVHKNGNKGLFVADVVSPCAVRRLEIYGENKYLRWDGTPETLFEYNVEKDALENIQLTEITEHQEGYRAFVVENAYKNEIRAFFAMIEEGKAPVYDFEKDKTILNLLDKMEKNND